MSVTFRSDRGIYHEVTYPKHQKNLDLNILHFRKFQCNNMDGPCGHYAK